MQASRYKLSKKRIRGRDCNEVDLGKVMKEKPYHLLNRVGLIGLYRMCLFDPNGGFEGTFFQKAWESEEIPELFEQRLILEK